MWDAFEDCFPDIDTPTKEAISQLVVKFRENGSYVDRSRVLSPTIITVWCVVSCHRIVGPFFWTHHSSQRSVIHCHAIYFAVGAWQTRLQLSVRWSDSSDHSRDNRVPPGIFRWLACLLPIIATSQSGPSPPKFFPMGLFERADVHHMCDRSERLGLQTEEET